MIAAVAGEPGQAPSGASFDALYRSCADDLFAYVASLLRDASAAEDVTALAFERAYRRRALFDLRRGTARSWLFAIARNAALDELRRRQRTRSLIVDLADDRIEDDGDDELAERRVLVRDGLASLEPRDREVILLKFVGRLSNGELARVLGCSDTAAGTRLHRAIERLREVCHAPQ
ncbi:MAG TPA: sigma-70 family RNA polymerase sigma factor [Solirubrobacteraceae bacterium]|nr:sigma-70 family RNA polymerase sigma factor [Solirubrobacteraceae bacterium]